MQPIFSDSRCLPPEETIEASPFRGDVSMARCSRWPTGAAAARVHRGSKTPTRPATARRFSRAFGRPRALLRLLQMSVSTSTTTDHSNIPDHRIGGWDDCRSMGSCLAIAATAGGTQGQGSRKTDLDAPRHDCSRRRLCPNPDRSRHLVSRAPFFALSGETRGRERVRRHHDCLHRSRDERVVRRPTSAKKSDVHQPEGPSIEGPPVRAVPCRPVRPEPFGRPLGAFFTTWNPFEGRSFRPG
jgi:hypothetical protein